MQDSFTAFKIQAEKIKYYKETKPELLMIGGKKLSEDQVFKEIGINNIPADRPNGYLRLRPEDFIVEEVKTDGGIVKINGLEKNYETIESGREKEKQTLYAQMVKIGIPTNVAITRISQALNIPLNKIGYSGLKDADAITAQLVAFPKTKISAEEIKNKIIPNILLTNFYYDKGSLAPGSLNANQFTITVRTEKNDESLRQRLAVIEEFGFLNYFQRQRFGGSRLISHQLGKLIMQGGYEEAVKTFLFASNQDDILIIKNLRQEAQENWGNWRKIHDLFAADFPYTFSNELKVLEFLVENQNDFINALKAIPDQITLWAYAYASLLFNRKLSEISRERGIINEKLPTILSDDPVDRKFYARYLESDNTNNYLKNLRVFPFVQIRKRLTPARIFPTNIQSAPFDGGAVISFRLGKGAYATTFLANLFKLHQDPPPPDWVKKTEIDPKKLINDGDLGLIKEYLKDYWYNKSENSL